MQGRICNFTQKIYVFVLYIILQIHTIAVSFSKNLCALVELLQLANYYRLIRVKHSLRKRRTDEIEQVTDTVISLLIYIILYQFFILRGY